MEVVKKMKTQEKVLKAVTDIFNSEYIPAVFREKNESGIPMDMVSLLYTEYGSGDGEAGVDLFFMPIEAAGKETQYFAIVINIADDVDASYTEELTRVLSILNFVTPFGTYACSPEGSSVFYKLVTPLPADLTEQELLGQINTLIANALDTAEGSVSLLQKYVKGKASIEDFKSLM